MGNSGKDLKTRDEAAEYLHLSSMTLYNLCRQGNGPTFYKFSPRGKMQFRIDDLDAWVDSCRVESVVADVSDEDEVSEEVVFEEEE